MELSPGSIRTFVVGTAYQLGNLVSSASSTIESTIGEKFPLPPIKGVPQRYNYGKVICILMACVYAYLIVITFLGPERLGNHFDAAHDSDLLQVAGPEGMKAAAGEGDPEKGTFVHQA
jgi:MFS transporter, SHS family, lactate transporter